MGNGNRTGRSQGGVATGQVGAAVAVPTPNATQPIATPHRGRGDRGGAGGDPIQVRPYHFIIIHSISAIIVVATFFLFSITMSLFVFFSFLIFILPGGPRSKPSRVTITEWMGRGHDCERRQILHRSCEQDNVLGGPKISCSWYCRPPQASKKEKQIAKVCGRSLCEGALINFSLGPLTSSFQVKRFTARLHDLQHDEGQLQFKVKRQNIFDDSYVLFLVGLSPAPDLT